MTTTSQVSVLDRWNTLDAEVAAREILPCCGSRAWAEGLAVRRPFADIQQLCDQSDRIWASLPEQDWREAFDSHPRIGQQHARAATAESLAWSSEEQRAAMSAAGSREDAAKLALAEGNRQYEERFGRIFIVCAAGKSAAEILELLNARMQNTAADELLEAAEQQRQITQLRLRRWLGAN
jgi:2-oxo-4-hydroxy-4-carboxy-5-ureidoimidazoline decarboxylase